MSRILITDGEQRAALAAVRSLGRAGHEVLVCSAATGSLAGASRFCSADLIVPDPLAEADAFTTRVRWIVEERGVDILLPMTEPALLALLPLSDTLPVQMPFPSASRFAEVSDKQRITEEAHRFGIRVPRQVTLNSAEAYSGFRDLSYPVVLKPSRSVFDAEGERRKSSIIHAATPGQCADALASLDRAAFPVLLQERIVGPGVGIFVLLWENTLVAAFAHRRIREKPPSGGVSVYRESVPLDEDLLARSVALLRAFDWQGVAMVEYKIDAATGTPYIMEINGRFWGSLQLAIDAGVDFPRLLIDAASGRHPAPVTTYRTGVRSRWEWGEIDHLIARLKMPRGEPGLRSGRMSAFAAMLGAALDPRSRAEIFRFTDPRPFLRESSLWLRDVFGTAVARRTLLKRDRS